MQQDAVQHMANRCFLEVKAFFSSLKAMRERHWQSKSASYSQQYTYNASSNKTRGTHASHQQVEQLCPIRNGSGQERANRSSCKPHADRRIEKREPKNRCHSMLSTDALLALTRNQIKPMEPKPSMIPETVARARLLPRRDSCDPYVLHYMCNVMLFQWQTRSAETAVVISAYGALMVMPLNSNSPMLVAMLSVPRDRYKKSCKDVKMCW